MQQRRRIAAAPEVEAAGAGAGGQRLVWSSRTLGHDIGESGWSESLLRELVLRLTGLGTVIISSEAGLPAELEQFRYRGRPSELHT